ncbi:hypothetical protein E2C01_062198 [Portunus trituberculatus]|uniref:Uncharacterized protein n=1 Tax=Portunus trituberculatus TaxID=210409 RepID=A0A5B7HDX2_PORTR|nr:hypothetical protein [Portunus trituberculatus]
MSRQQKPAVRWRSGQGRRWFLLLTPLNGLGPPCFASQLGSRVLHVTAALQVINAVNSIFIWCEEGRREKLEPWVSQADVWRMRVGSCHRVRGEDRGEETRGRRARADWSSLATGAEKSVPREGNNGGADQ